jgi:nucleoid DNA-binding protein
LNPRKAKTLIEDVSEATGFSEDTVSTVVSYYWQEVRKQLSSLAHTRVHITNLGDFTIKHWKIDEKIQMLEKWEENNKQKGLQQMTARYRTAENLYELRKMRELMLEEKQRAEFIRLHKKTTYEQTKQHHSHMESQRSDT